MTGVFEMMTGPYIPTEHMPLDVLPWNREEGYEVPYILSRGEFRLE